MIVERSEPLERVVDGGAREERGRRVEQERPQIGERTLGIGGNGFEQRFEVVLAHSGRVGCVGHRRHL